MQYKIDATPEQIQALTPHFTGFEYAVKNRQLHIYTDDNDDCTITFFSMVRGILDLPVSIDYMTRDLVKFVVL